MPKAAIKEASSQEGHEIRNDTRKPEPFTRMVKSSQAQRFRNWYTT